MIIRAQWDGEHFIPSDRHKRQLDKELTVGEVYLIEPTLPRSMASHRHYFAAIHNAWDNLPLGVQDQWPSSEDLRKHALIMTGYANVQTYVYDTDRAAQKARDMLMGLLRKHEYCLIDVRGRVVRIRHAKSQSVAAMDRQEFQKSKQDVLDYLASMVGVTPAQLENEHAA